MAQDEHTGGGSDSDNNTAEPSSRLQPETDHGYGGVVDDRDAEKQASSPFFGIHSAKALQELVSSTESTTQLSLRMEAELDRLAAAGRARKRSLLTPMQRRALGLDGDEDTGADDDIIVEHVGNDIIDAARESMRSQSALSDAERRELEMYRARAQSGEPGAAAASADNTDTTESRDNADADTNAGTAGLADDTERMDFVQQVSGFVVRPSSTTQSETQLASQTDTQRSRQAGVSGVTENNQLSISSQNVQNNHKKVTNMTDWGLYSSQGTTSRVQAVIDAYTELTAVEKHLVNDKLQLQPAHIVAELQAMLTEAADQLALAQQYDREKYADETFPGLEGEALQDALIKRNQEYAQRIRELEGSGDTSAPSQQALSQGSATETTHHEDTPDHTGDKDTPESSSTTESTIDSPAHSNEDTDDTPGGDRGGSGEPADGTDSIDGPVDSRGDDPAGLESHGGGGQGDGSQNDSKSQHTQTIPQAAPAGTAPTLQRSGRDIRNATQRAQRTHATTHGTGHGGVVASVIEADDFAHTRADAVAAFDNAAAGSTAVDDAAADDAARDTATGDTAAEDTTRAGSETEGGGTETSASVRRSDTSDADHPVADAQADEEPESIAVGDDVDVDVDYAADVFDDTMLVEADDADDDGDSDADGDTGSDNATSGGRERVPDVDEDAINDAFPDDDELGDDEAETDDDAGLGDYMRQADPLDAVDDAEPEVGA